MARKRLGRQNTYSPAEQPTPKEYKITFLDCPAIWPEMTARNAAFPRDQIPVHHEIDGWPTESVMIRCSLGHWFNGLVDFFTGNKRGQAPRPGGADRQQADRPAMAARPC